MFLTICQMHFNKNTSNSVNLPMTSIGIVKNTCSSAREINLRAAVGEVKTESFPAEKSIFINDVFWPEGNKSNLNVFILSVQQYIHHVSQYIALV